MQTYNRKSRKGKNLGEQEEKEISQGLMVFKGRQRRGEEISYSKGNRRKRT